MSASASEPTAQPSEGRRDSADGTLENGVALLASCLKYHFSDNIYHKPQDQSNEKLQRLRVENIKNVFHTATLSPTPLPGLSSIMKSKTSRGGSFQDHKIHVFFHAWKRELLKNQ